MIVWGCFQNIEGQSFNNNLRAKTIIINKDTVNLDSFKIVPNSLKITQNGIEFKDYSIDYQSSSVIFNSKYLNLKLNVEYRVFSISTKNNYANKNKKLIEPVFLTTPRYLYNYNETNDKNNSFFSDGLNINGNISRGVSVGNNQDMIVNSNLNLQMNGNLGKGFKILAAISDENNPIQPQGNTQQIQDFDKIFISFVKDSNTLTVGDFLMQNNSQSYFMRYYKKSRGVQLDLNSKTKLGAINNTVNAAISRGKFSRNEIQGTEGNQGPYRLSGVNNEQNIIIISGTEVVYIDGQKMERGQQNDYVIDYNIGEIIFMPKRLINKFNRIVVEFQYSDRNYTRTVFSTSSSITNNKWINTLQYFTEQDNRFQPTDTFNRNSIQSILENAGDNKAIFFSSRTYNQLQKDRINYIKKDSLGFEIYQFTNQEEADSIYYSLTFSLVGANQGNYILVSSSANGRVFAWVAPLAGVPSGNYEPIIELIAPQRNQLLSYSSIYKPNDKTYFKIEGAYSNNNKNTFSNLDKRNDDGLGLFLNFKQSKLKKGDFEFNNSVNIEFVNSNFKFVERYRAVEFNRIWNRQLNNQSSIGSSTNEWISDISSQIAYKNRHFLKLDFSNFNRNQLFDGFRGFANYTFSKANSIFKISSEKLSSQEQLTGLSRKNDIQSLNSSFTYSLEKLSLSTGFNYEESVFNTDTSNNYQLNSFRYVQSNFNLKSRETKQWIYNFDASLRQDYNPLGQSFVLNSTGINYSANLQYASKKNNRLDIVHTYRYLREKNSTEDPETILGRIEYIGNFLKKSIVSSTFYQVGTGREQKRQFSYLPVLTGTGTHSWNDYNSNGLEEIDEFEVAAFKDKANYVKVLLPTNEFIKSNINEFNQSFRIQAPATWQGENIFKRWVSKFNTITSYKTDRRITDNSIETILNPLKLNISDSSLIAVNSLIKQTTFFNRSSSKFGIEHNIQSANGKQLLNNGFEWRTQNKNSITSRIGLSKSFGLIVFLEESKKTSKNNFFENRSFDYTSQIFSNEIIFQNTKNLRLGANYKYTQSINKPLLSDEKGYIHDFSFDARYFIINKGNIDVKISQININYIGNTNSPLAFEILNGLSNGQNIVWNLTLGGKAKNNIQLNLNYEGRKNVNNRAIHIGRVEARYIF